MSECKNNQKDSQELAHDVVAIEPSEPARQRRGLILGLTGSAALALWHKPVVNAVLTPAHAQTSEMPEPEPEPEPCPTLTTGNVTTGPVSGTNVPAVCTATFDIFNSDSATEVTVTAIDTGTLPANVTVDVQDLGVTTPTSGPRVVWRGPATDAPFCSDLMPTDDITFTVTASCTDNPTPFTQTFMLSEIIAP